LDAHLTAIAITAALVIGAAVVLYWVLKEP
jgi:hypothetical protein